MMHRRFGPQFDEFAKEQDFIRVLEDRSHTGKADFNAIYGGPFSKPEDGIAAGVLARNGTVWATIIPHLWKFEGMNADGHAEKTESISDGYGVRFNYTGHDLHGLIMGPDGKLYFSEGDRGANATSKDGSHVSNPDAGGVFRCNPDGTELELVHGGLRNPQELAFDDYGNLFTGDNDFDYGDTERLVYVVEGGDSGWRVGYQHPPLGKERVTWKAEQIWVCFNTSQDQYDGKPHPTINIDKGVRPIAYLPPVSNIGDGPSGLLYDPGTGISPAFRHHFFLCQCKGSYARSEKNSCACSVTKTAGSAWTPSSNWPSARMPSPSKPPPPAKPRFSLASTPSGAAVSCSAALPT
jgi:quinoprotein glucose dehydrogenase